MIRYEIERDPTTCWGNEVWNVVRVLSPGETYLVAKFPDRSIAVECLEILNRSIDASGMLPNASSEGAAKWQTAGT